MVGYVSVQVNYMARDMVAAGSSAAGGRVEAGVGEGIAGIAHIAEMAAQARVTDEAGNKRKFVPASSASAPPPEKRVATERSNPDEIDIDDLPQDEEEQDAMADIGITRRPVPSAVFGSAAAAASSTLGALDRFSQE